MFSRHCSRISGLDWRTFKLSLAGRSAQLPGIASSFTDQLGVPTEVASPMRHFRNRYNSKGESNDSAATAVSVGLAIGAVA